MRYSNLLSLTVVLGVTACAGAEEGDYPDAVTADPSHYAVEFENDVARILRITYGPGERSVMHHHPAHCAVELTDGMWRMTDADGTETEDSSPMGEVTCVEEGVHLPENMLESTAEAVVVELKGGQAGMWSSEHPNAVTADADHYPVEFENDAVRIVRINYGPGERSVMHSHAANCFMALGPMTVRMTDAEGETEDVTMSPGLLQCGDAEAHLPENIGSGTSEGILIEFKGRDMLGGESAVP